jgi:hypothetical protein
MRKHNPKHLRIRIPNARSVDTLALVQRQSTMSMMSFRRALWYLVLFAALAVLTVLYALTWSQGSDLKSLDLVQGWKTWNMPGSNNLDVAQVESEEEEARPQALHPIEHLIDLATQHFYDTSQHETRSLSQAAAQYRKRRGRHPPPGFSAWHAYATAHNATINERLWDQIYDDLAPFWSIKPVLLRKQAHVFTPKISIRGNKVKAKSHNKHAKLGQWKDMLSTLAAQQNVDLPDVDLPLNVNNESAMLVPWEAIDTAMSLTRKMMLNASDIIGEFTSLDGIEHLTAGYTWTPEWLGPRLHHPSSHLGPRPLWTLVRAACPPASPARLGHVYTDIWDPWVETQDEHVATALLPRHLPTHTLQGYVQNWTHATNACQHPHVQALHTAFVAPENMGVAASLFPLFGAAKFGVGNEILIPPWPLSSSISPPSVPWSSRRNTLYVRTPSSRSHDAKRYWRYFHAERLVALLNATHVEIAEAAIHDGNASILGVEHAQNFRLLPANEYELEAQSGGRLAKWVAGWADAGLMDVECAGEKGGGCAEFFHLTSIDKEKSRAARYAVATDDAGDAGSLIAILRGGKVTLRATVYRNWFDARLVPWVHFVPLDNTFVDLYGVVEYFLGSEIREGKVPEHAVGEVQEHELHFHTPEGLEKEKSTAVKDKEGDDQMSTVWLQKKVRRLSNRRSHDKAAQRIAVVGKEWASRVLRDEDALIYTYRLLLEYARVLDDKRDGLGWVDDLR